MCVCVCMHVCMEGGREGDDESEGWESGDEVDAGDQVCVFFIYVCVEGDDES